MNVREQNELSLVCAARRGDKEALQTLLKRNWGWLKGVVYSVLADRQDLDDVMQEVCLRVIGRIETLREPERFRAWLAVLARREAMRYRRHRTPEPVASDGFGCVGDPAEAADRKELCGQVLEAVRRLPEKYREVIVQAGDAEHRTTVGDLDALPEKYRGPAREAVENARKGVRRDVTIGRRFRLPEPPRPEVLQRFRRSLPRPDMDRLSEHRDRTLEMLQEQMERLQQRMEALEEHNREILNRLRERTSMRRERPPAPKPSEPMDSDLDPAI